MKNLLIISLFLTFSQFVLAQEQISNHPIEGEYMEVRFVSMQGLSFRLSPNSPFEKVGFLNKNLKPYFKQYDESLRYQKQYNRSFIGLAGGATLYGLGSATILLGGLSGSAGAVRIGSAAFISGLGVTMYSDYIRSRSIYKAVDAYNRNKNQNIKNAQYLEAIPHPVIRWQYRTSPTNDYKTVGLYGKKLKKHVQGNEEAYRAFKKYRAGNIAYSLGNIVALTGSTVMLAGVLANNQDLSKTGLTTSVGGIAAIFAGSGMMNKNIYLALDLMNYDKSPILNSSLIPSLQPSSHSAGLGLVWNIE